MSTQTKASLGQVLPAGVVLVQAADADWQAPLHPEEERTLGPAAGRRREEFCASRACARRALEQLGVPADAVPRDAQRVPVWPEGVVGSITHTRKFAAAAVARSDLYGGLGIDVEIIERLEASNVESAITNGAERKWLASQAPALRGQAMALLFSAKEAAYKAVFPTFREVFGFRSAEFSLVGDGLDAGAFQVEFASSKRSSQVGAVHGRFVAAEGRMMTAAWLRSPDSKD